MNQTESPPTTGPTWAEVTNLDSRRKLGSPIQRDQWKHALCEAIRIHPDVIVRCHICNEFTLRMKMTKKGLPFAHCSACWIQIHARSSTVFQWLLEQTCQAAIDHTHQEQAHG